jgi:hypothetical protein
MNLAVFLASPLLFFMSTLGAVLGSFAGKYYFRDTFESEGACSNVLGITCPPSGLNKICCMLIRDFRVVESYPCTALFT